MTVEPKFSTPRDYSRPTLGGIQAAFSEVWLGQKFMPWQRHVADLSGELVEDPETGLLVPAHSLVVVTVQRQAGKSHLSMTQTGERAFALANFRAWYTAQTGGDARDQFLKFADEVVKDQSKGTPLSKMVKVLRGNGHEVMRFLNGSTIRPYAPTEEGIHGKQSDRNDIDEGWAFSSQELRNLLQGSGPAGLTRPHSQTFIWSAGGTANSTGLAELVARGRAGDPTICYVEYGIPDDLKIEGDLSDDDYAAIAAHHPAVGHTITVGALKKLRSTLPDDAEYARAAGNRWTEIIGGAISKAMLESAWHTPEIPDGVQFGWGAATSADRTETVIVAAAKVGELVVCEVAEVIPRAHNTAKQVAAWANGQPLAIDRVGPSAPLAAEVAKVKRVNLMDIGLAQAQTAAANLMDGMKGGVFKLRPHNAFEQAAKVVALRHVGDGGFVWSRAKAGASIAAWEAAGLAALAAGESKPQEKPMMRFAASA